MNFETQDRTLAPINGSIMTYDELIDEAQKRYREYLDASRNASKLNDRLTRIMEEADGDEGPDDD